MLHLGRLIEVTIEHFKEHWQTHLPFAGGFGVVAMVGVLFIYGSFFGAVIVSEVIGLDEAFAALFAVAGGMVGFFALTLTFGVGMFSYMRLISALHRGTEPDALLPTGRELLGIFGISAVSFFVIAFGTALCVLPGIVAGFALSLSSAAHALEGGGVMRSIQRSVDIFRDHTLDLAVFLFIIQGIAGAIGGLPCIGLFLILPIITVGYTIAFLELGNLEPA